jgi:hypothetical protein
MEDGMARDRILWDEAEEVAAGQFEDAIGTTFRIAESVRIADEDCIALGRAPKPMILTRAQVKMLLPHLQAFAEVGKLSPKVTLRT